MSESPGFELNCPFWVDTEAYSDRDRAMFTAGFEFCLVLTEIEDGGGDRITRPIHRENESRVRMACARLGRRCTIRSCDPEHDPDGTWSYLEIEPS